MNNKFGGIPRGMIDLSNDGEEFMKTHRITASIVDGKSVFNVRCQKSDYSFNIISSELAEKEAFECDCGARILSSDFGKIIIPFDS